MSLACAFSLPEVAGRVLLVDQRGHAEFQTLAAAAKAVAPGDTIKLAPGSGPYREMLFIATSGTPDAPITFDGSGETITGFEPLGGFVEREGVWSCDLGQFYRTKEAVQGFQKVGDRWTSAIRPLPVPFVLAYQGKRVRQDRLTGQFMQYATLSPDGSRLVLRPGISPEGWEISARYFVVRIANASYQTYRNVTATGSLNDGFNLHGSGSNLFFDHVSGCDNLDEGFSAHDDIKCSINVGRFVANDNGINNAHRSVMIATDVVARDNLGFGIALVVGAKAELHRADSSGNGVAQLWLRDGATILLDRVTLQGGGWREKPWLSCQESGEIVASEVSSVSADAILNGEPPIVLEPVSGKHSP